MESFLKGKKALILGVANERSIAWGVAKFLQEHGVKVGFCYQPGLLETKARSLIENSEHEFVHELDISSDVSLRKFFEFVRFKWTSFDFLLHSIAFANKEDLQNRYVETSREGFLRALDVSCYSFTKVLQLSQDFMTFGGSCVTLSYYGAQKYIPNYNVMGVAKAALEASVRYLAADLGPQGIRVNAISAGPVRTLSSAGISDFRSILDVCKVNSPLRRNVTLEDIAKTAAFLFSDLSDGITGQSVFVDGGYSILGVTNMGDK